MKEEINSIRKNDTWELTTLPEGHNAIRVKWIFKTKKNAEGEIEKHKARLAAKRILRFIKGTLNYGLCYSSSQNFEITGYSDNDRAGSLEDRKSTTGFIFFMGETTFTWTSKK